MEDRFFEVIVPRRPRPQDTVGKVLLIAGTVLAAAGALLVSRVFFLLLVGFIVADYFIFPRFNVEYEYSYLNGEIDVAAIYSKQSRKNLETITLENAECIAPSGSHRLDSFGVTFKVVDYSSGDPSHRTFAIVKGGSDSRKYLLELDDRMLEDLKWRLPGKVFQD